MCFSFIYCALWPIVNSEFVFWFFFFFQQNLKLKNRYLIFIMCLRPLKSQETWICKPLLNCVCSSSAVMHIQHRETCHQKSAYFKSYWCHLYDFHYWCIWFSWTWDWFILAKSINRVHLCYFLTTGSCSNHWISAVKWFSHGPHPAAVISLLKNLGIIIPIPLISQTLVHVKEDSLIWAPLPKQSTQRAVFPPIEV